MNLKLHRVAMVLLAVALVMAQVQPAPACTEFILKVQDGGFIIGRSLEFGWNPGYQVVVHPRGEPGSSDAPGGKKGIHWTAKYGYLAVESFGNASDGLNEAGLSVGALYLPGYTKYQDEAAANQACQGPCSSRLIPLMKLTSERIDYLYDLMDAAYDAQPIYAVSRSLGHVPFVDSFRTELALPSSELLATINDWPPIN